MLLLLYLLLSPLLHQFLLLLLLPLPLLLLLQVRPPLLRSLVCRLALRPTQPQRKLHMALHLSTTTATKASIHSTLQLQ
jgi:hypothetical protein